MKITPWEPKRGCFPGNSEITQRQCLINGSAIIVSLISIQKSVVSYCSISKFSTNKLTLSRFRYIRSKYQSSLNTSHIENWENGPHLHLIYYIDEFSK